MEKELEKLFNKGVAALDEGNWLRAVQYFKKCQQMDSSYLPAYHELADIYYFNGQLDAALAEIKDALVLAPDDPEANFALGSIYVSQDKYKEALRVFKRLEGETGEQSAELYYNIGICYKNLGHNETALEYLESALEEDPSYYECLDPIGSIQLAAGKLDEAKKTFLELLDADPANINAHHMLGVIYSKQFMWKAAMEEWETVLNMAPNTDEALRELGWALNMTGEYEQAVNSLRKALEMNPHNLQARIDLGAVFFSNHKVEDAVREWEEARREDPGNPLIKKFLSDADALGGSKEGQGKD